MLEVRQTEVYAKWFAGLRDSQTRARINARIRRLSLGNPGDVKPVGAGVSELRIDFGPGYRVYYIQRGEQVIILPAGGDKRTQTRDILTARTLAGELWEINMANKPIKTYPWDPVDYLENDEDMVAYLDAALEDGDPALILAVLGDIARARGMTQVAGEAGLGRESLYKSLSATGNPEFATVLKVLNSLGLQLHVAAAK